jgi:hypothetical protein
LQKCRRDNGGEYRCGVRSHKKKAKRQAIHWNNFTLDVSYKEDAQGQNGDSVPRPNPEYERKRDFNAYEIIAVGCCAAVLQAIILLLCGVMIYCFRRNRNEEVGSGELTSGTIRGQNDAKPEVDRLATETSPGQASDAPASEDDVATGAAQPGKLKHRHYENTTV